ncbi:MAG: hypothetical protein KGZ79_16485 [Dethiobacter sp.]|nr:hypothetical protein [Dethiobacter sp.]MBS4023989.1 hypothetical protein [Dethiobacter sp.]
MQVKKHDAILIHPSDNVAVAIKDLTKGQTVHVLGDSFHAEMVLTSDVAFIKQVHPPYRKWWSMHSGLHVQDW